MTNPHSNLCMFTITKIQLVVCLAFGISWYRWIMIDFYSSHSELACPLTKIVHLHKYYRFFFCYLICPCYQECMFPSPSFYPRKYSVWGTSQPKTLQKQLCSLKRSILSPATLMSIEWGSCALAGIIFPTWEDKWARSQRHYCPHRKAICIYMCYLHPKRLLKKQAGLTWSQLLSATE